MIQTKRANGILMSITSLPSDFGIGDLGPSTMKFVDLLSESKQSFWQVLPVTPTGQGNSPYDPISCFAGNTLLISPEILEAEKLLDNVSGVAEHHPHSTRVNFNNTAALKREIIQNAYSLFEERGDRGEFEEFCADNSTWLEDYSLYVALREKTHKPWFLWPRELRDRQNDALAESKMKLRDIVEREKFAQFEFFKQWHSLKDYCASHKIGLVGDLPFYVAYDIAEIWCNREIFKLDSEGRPTFVGGVPPDNFSKTGQLWGSPVYDWDRLRTESFDWWIQRIQQALKLFDIVRLDHFRGFVAYWEVPGTAKTAASGLWIATPSIDFLQTVKTRFPSMPFLADDLALSLQMLEQL